MSNKPKKQYDSVSLFAALGSPQQELEGLSYYLTQKEVVQDHFCIKKLEVYRKAGWNSCRFNITVALRDDRKREFKTSGWVRQQGHFAEFRGLDRGVNGYYAKQDDKYNDVLTKDGKKQSDFKRPIISGPAEYLNPEIEMLYKLDPEKIPAMGHRMGQTENIRIRSKLEQGYSIIAWKQNNGRYVFTADLKLPYKLRASLEEYIKTELNNKRWKSLKVVTRRAKAAPKGTKKTDVKHPKKRKAKSKASDDNGAGVPGKKAANIATNLKDAKAGK